MTISCVYEQTGLSMVKGNIGTFSCLIFECASDSQGSISLPPHPFNNYPNLFNNYYYLLHFLGPGWSGVEKWALPNILLNMFKFICLFHNNIFLYIIFHPLIYYLFTLFIIINIFRSTWKSTKKYRLNFFIAASLDVKVFLFYLSVGEIMDLFVLNCLFIFNSL